jgi:hypothetical protein
VKTEIVQRDWKFDSEKKERGKHSFNDKSTAVSELKLNLQEQENVIK